jgi:hypothetical protein
MSRHSPPSKENDESRNKVPLRSPVSLSAEPNSGQTRTPPNDAHSRVLDIISSPRFTPPMFSEGIDTAPGRNKSRVKKFL